MAVRRTRKINGLAHHAPNTRRSVSNCLTENDQTRNSGGRQYVSIYETKSTDHAHCQTS